MAGDMDRAGSMLTRRRRCAAIARPHRVEAEMSDKILGEVAAFPVTHRPPRQPTVTNGRRHDRMDLVRLVCGPGGLCGGPLRVGVGQAFRIASTTLRGSQARSSGAAR
jgi:hypothetical protein